MTALLNESGIDVGKDRVQRIWRREGLKVPQKQPKRGRLWLTDGSCVRLRPGHRNHVWSFDFVETQTHDGRRLRLMTLIDEFTRKCLAIRVARRINAIGVIETLADAMLFEGTPLHIRSDNGPEMVAKVLRQWLAGLGTKSLYIEPGFALGEWLLRVLQWKTQGRVPQWRDLLQLEGGPNHHRKLAQTLQH